MPNESETLVRGLACEALIMAQIQPPDGLASVLARMEAIIHWAMYLASEECSARPILPRDREIAHFALNSLRCRLVEPGRSPEDQINLAGVLVLIDAEMEGWR